MNATTNRPTARKLRNVLVMYEGGGYEGCWNEKNYAYFDQHGQFHSIAASGYKGCPTLEKFQERGVLNHQETDLYRLNKRSEIERFGREAPISHLIGCAKWFAENGPDVVLTVECDSCGLTVPVMRTTGDGCHGIGGIRYQYDRIICENCECEGEEDAS